MKGKNEQEKRNFGKSVTSLIRRGEIYLTLDFLKSWVRDLEKLNHDKRWSRYEYSLSFIELHRYRVQKSTRNNFRRNRYALTLLMRERGVEPRNTFVIGS